MGKTITTILVVLLLIVGGFWIFGGGDGDIALDDNNATTTQDELTGTGGPEDGFDPLEDFESSNSGETEIQGKG